MIQGDTIKPGESEMTTLVTAENEGRNYIVDAGGQSDDFETIIPESPAQSIATDPPAINSASWLIYIGAMIAGLFVISLLIRFFFPYWHG